jgi:flagellar assembly protein FliH
MTIIKKEDWQNSGRFVRNYPDENPVPEQPTNAIQAAASDSADDPLAPSQAYVLDAQDAASREAERQAFEAELIDLKKETLDAAYAAGFEKGKTEGFESGSADALNQYQADSAALLNAVNLLSKEETNLIKHSQTGLVTLASKIARRLLSCELTLNPNVIHHIVSEALTKITDKSTVSIRVHPDDLPALPDIQTLHLDSDPNIEPGGCMIETSLGYIDATVATKLASIELAIQTVDGPTKSEPESDLESEPESDLESDLESS